MKLEKLSAVAEIVSSLAIVVTLVYLAAQTQQNTQALRASTRQASADAEVEWLYRGMEHPEALFSRYYAEFLDGEYSDDSIQSTTSLAVALLRLRENLWLQYQDGALDAEIWTPYRDTFSRMILNDEVWKASWNQFSVQMTPSFREEIDNRIEELRKTQTAQ